MLKKLIITGTLCLLVLLSKGQGVSFSYLIPTNGYFAAPVSPFSLRGIHLGGNIIGLETGFTLYYIPGLPVSDIPVETDKPIVGPQFAILIPLQAAVRLPLGRGGFKILGGVFGQQHFAGKVLEGNLDRAIRESEGLLIVNSDVDIENKPGWGMIGGVEIEFPFNDQVNLSFGVQYLYGTSGSPINGEYRALNDEGDLILVDIDYADAITELQGFEISIGASF